MNNKPTILMLCSWLGSFFDEQAKVMTEKYNIILATFRYENITWKATIKRIIKRKSLFSIQKEISKNGLDTYIVTCPNFYFLKPLFNRNVVNYKINKIGVELLNSYLKSNSIHIDLIHAQSLFNAGFISYQYNQLFNTPYILTEHNQLSLRNCIDEDFAYIENILKNSKFNLVVSNDKIRQFAANQLFSDFVNVGNFVDDKIFNNSSNRPSNVFKIVTVAANAEIKDFNTLFKALKLLDNQITEADIKCEYTWVGCVGWSLKGPTTIKDAEYLANQFQLKNIKINLIGKAERMEVAEILKQSHLFLFSSISEGLTVSILEALACGTPVLTTNCGGVDEIIDNTNGRIVQIKDYNALAYELINITKNYNFNHEFISKQAILRFGKIEFVNKIDQIYESSIK